MRLYSLLKPLRLGFGRQLRGAKGGLLRATPERMVNEAIMALKRDAGRLSSRQRDIGLALLVAAAVVLVHAVKGFPLIYGENADNDSLMRMVEVLDWLSGQGWYDLHQYRMGPAGGFLMHWSRFVDAPIAALLLLAKAVTGGMESAQTIVEILYPALLMAATLYLLLRFVRRLGNEEALLPATFIGALALYQLPLFQSAALDHHNVQLVLVLMTMLFLLEAPRRPMTGFAAGTMAALSLVVGMETAPYVALAGAVAALGFLFRGEAERRSAAMFGAGFAVVSAASFLATVPASLWAAPRCDAFTLPQMSIAALAGAGLFVIATVPACGATFRNRFLSFMVLAAAVAALLVLAFPECLAAPYAGLDPKLRTYWLDSVTEAQSFRRILMAQPVMVATYYCTPFLAALTMLLRARRARPDRDELIFGAFLLAAVLVSLWQVRGVYFSIPLSIVPLAVWVGEWRARIADRPVKGGAAKLIAVWLLSFNIAWSSAAEAAIGRLAPQKASGGGGVPQGACLSPGDYATLASMPRTTVLAITNLGAPILRYTGQRALAGPYHRNAEGALAALNALIGTDQEALAVIRRYGVTIVASCPGNVETKSLDHEAPAGLAARLGRNERPAWLAPVPSTADQPLKLFRVVLK
jgi:hypothetical protein